VSQFKYLGMTVTNQFWFKRKSRGDWILVMHATIRFRTFCPITCCQKMWRLEYTRL
jgi:hypothetical protein